MHYKWSITAIVPLTLTLRQLLRHNALKHNVQGYIVFYMYIVDKDHKHHLTGCQWPYECRQ